jgi:hypothetical protein
MDWQQSKSLRWRQEITGTTTDLQDQVRNIWNLYIEGPAGIVRADDMGAYAGAPHQAIETAYWDIVHTLDGHYHCCLTGKVWYLT